MAKTLSQWNWAAFALHATAAIVTYSILTESGRSKRLVYMMHLGYDPEYQTDSRVDLPVKLQSDMTMDLKYFIVLFFAVTALAHLVYATDFFGRKWYSSAVLGYGWNPYRWIEYSISASIMTYIITIVSGTKEQVSAIASALIVPSLMISGLTTERALNQNSFHRFSQHGGTHRVDPVVVWFNILPSWFLFFTNWFIILFNYFRISYQASDAGNPIDPSVTFMVYSQVVFFSLFGVILSYQTYRWASAKKGRIEPTFEVYEKAYIILSAVTKLVLAAVVVYAVRD